MDIPQDGGVGGKCYTNCWSSLEMYSLFFRIQRGSQMSDYNTWTMDWTGLDCSSLGSSFGNCNLLLIIIDNYEINNALCP